MRTLRVHSLLLVLALLLAGIPALAQTASPPAAKAKATPPPPAPAKDVRFPPFEQKTLANGLRVVVIEQHEQPLVSLRMVLKAGKTFDPAGKAGLATATADLLTKGTATRSAQQIAETIDFVGGNLGANTGLESGFANAAVTSDQIDLGFDLLSDVVLHPTFPDEEIERWRRQALSGLQVQQQDAGYLAATALQRVLFGSHPYGNPGTGTPESLQGLTRDDLVAFHKQRYVPNDTILAIVGDVKPADAFARAEKAFGSWPKGEPAQIPAIDASQSKRRIVVIDKPDAVQTEIHVGQVGIAFRDPDLHVERVYNNVLGGTPSARLFDEVRRKRGLAYGAGSGFLEATQPGSFEANTSTKTESTVEALEVMLDVIRGVGKEPAPASELGLAKTFITGSFPLEIETADGIAGKVLEAMKFGYGREFLESYNDKIAQIGAADVQRFAKERIHPDDLSIVLAGNASAFSEALKKKFGAFETIPAAEVDFLRADLRKPKAEKAAATPVSAADQAKGLELAQKAQAALGGKAFVEQRTQTAKGSGTVTPPGMPQPMPISSIVTYRVFPDKERTEIQLPMGTMIQSFDGKTGWTSMGPQTQDTTAQGKEEQLYGYDLLRRAGQPGYTARPLPDGVEIADAEGHATRFFIDPQTGLVTKVAFEANGQQNEAVYTDYREVSGVKIPFQTNVSQNGHPFLEVKYSEVKVNAPVDEGVFKKPVG